MNGLINAGLNDYSISDKLKAGALFLASALIITSSAGAGGVVEGSASGTSTGTSTVTIGRGLLSNVANDNAWPLAASFLAYIGIGNRKK